MRASRRRKKCCGAVGAAEQGFGGIDHHESRDDEEQIDARRAEQEILNGPGAPPSNATFSVAACSVSTPIAATARST